MIKIVTSFRNEVHLVLACGRTITQYLPSEAHAKRRVVDIIDGKYVVDLA